MSDPVHTLFGEAVTPVSPVSMLRWALVGGLWGYVAGYFGLDAGVLAVTMFTSACLTNMGFPMGVKYIVVCVCASLGVSMLVRGLF